MKKFLIGVSIIGFLILAGGAIFLATFNLDHYRSQIENKISNVIGSPVRIGHISLTWRGGLAVEVSGVQILSNDEPVLQVESAGAVLKLTPLLRSSIQMATIFVDGAEVRVIKSVDGKIQVQGIHPPLPPTSSTEVPMSSDTAVSAPETASAVASFFVGKLNLKNIRLHYEDDTPAFPVQLDIQKISVSVKDVAFYKTMKFSAAAAVFGSRQDVKLSGQIKIVDQGRDVRVENLKAEVDLDSLDWGEMARSVPALTTKSPVTSMGGKLKADVDSLTFKNGKLDNFEADVSWVDGKVAAWGPSTVLDHAQFSMSHFRLYAPVDFKFQAAVLSDSSNLRFQGRLDWGDAGHVTLSSVQADLDLDRLSWNRVESFLPVVSGAGLAASPEGKIHADIRRADFQPLREPILDIDFRYDQGRLRLKSLPQDLNQIHATGTLRNDQLTFDAWNMNFGSSPAEGRVNVQNLFKAPVFRTEIRAKNLDLQSLIPSSRSSQPSPQLEGKLSFEVNVDGGGKVPEVIIPSLSGGGHFRLENVVVQNLNVLEQIFSKLSAIPGFSDAVNQRMSDQLKQRLDRRDTHLQTIDQEFKINRGQIYFPNMEVITPDVMARGTTTIALDGAVDAQLTVFIHEEIMAELADRVHELTYVLNPQGQMQIPLRMTGKAPAIQVLPDIQFLISEIVRSRGSQMIGQLAQRVASGQGAGKLSQILGVKPYAARVNDQQNTENAQTVQDAADDNSVPVKVYSAQASQPKSLLDMITGQVSQNTTGQSGNRKLQAAAGVLNALFSNSSDASSQDSTQNQTSNSSNNNY